MSVTDYIRKLREGRRQDEIVVPNEPLPVGTMLGVVLGDTCGLSRPSHNELHEAKVPLCSKLPPKYGLPATIKTFNSRFMKLTRPWQNYWFGLLKLAAPTWEVGNLKRAWASLTKSDRCYTNGKGSDILADYINGQNLDKGPMMKETIFTTGAILSILDHGKVYAMRGGLYYKIAILDGRKNPPALPTSIERSPWLHWATISRRELEWNGSNWTGREDYVIRFPQLDGLNVPVPNMGYGTFDYVPVERIRILAAGEVAPDPYIYPTR